MDTPPQWPQGIGVGIEKSGGPGGGVQKKQTRPQKEQALNCPRCSSTNTKFCYYNNYSLSQPRYFCKTCRRYWTEGGTLRNVPVGGGSRKNKRPNACPEPSSKKVAAGADLSNPPNFGSQNPKIHQGHDLNLGFNPPYFDGVSSEFVAASFGIQNPNFSQNHHLPAMELFKSGDYVGPRGVSPLMSAPVSGTNLLYVSSSGFNPVSELKSSLGFSSVDQQNGYNNGNMQRMVDQDHHQIINSPSSSRVNLFPFEELKPIPNNELTQGRVQGEPTGCLINGMLAGGSW